jgi:RNA polymerase sigma-70 factor (ECF subfamily)
MSSTTPTAAQLRRFSEGDLAVAELLGARALTLALRTAAAIVATREDAHDVALVVAVDVLRTADALRDPAAFDAWVHRITVRRSLRHLRSRRARHAAERPLALLTEAGEPAVRRRSMARAISDREALAAALGALPARQQVALTLRYVHDLSDAQIAAALGCRPGTVHALLSRGRAAMRRDPRLADYAAATTITPAEGSTP